VSEERLVSTACSLVDIPSPTGSEQLMGERMAELMEALGLQVQWQEVEAGRPNVLGILDGAGGGPTLMFNGHMDTSYSGKEPWLRDKEGFQPTAFVKDGSVFGLGSRT
jgi:acetylornithine deacetylase/succinyl-diaminopimelate desuccinylase-like protein